MPATWTDGLRDEGGVRLSAEHASGGDCELYHLEVVRPDSWDSSLSWRITVDLLHREGAVDCGLSVEQDISHLRVAPSPLQPPLVGLLPELSRRGAMAGDQRARSVPQAITGTAAIDRFVASVLLSPQRALPVVLFTAIKERDGVYFPEMMDPSLMARELCGLAHVYVLPRVEDTHKLTRRLGLLCAYDGAVRLYWPRMRLDDPPQQHTLLLRQKLNRSSGPAIIRRIIDAAARAYRAPDGAETMLAAYRRQSERRRLAALLRTADGGQGSVDALSRELQRVLDDNVRLVHELDATRAELQQLRRHLLAHPAQEDDVELTGEAAAARAELQAEANAETT